MKQQLFETEVCSEHHHHLNLHVPQIDTDDLYQLADLFKVFGDPTRLRILYTLSDGELCVCDIASLLNMSQSAISHQLRFLKQARLVKSRKNGKTVYYALCDDHIQTILAQGIAHVQEG